MQATSPAKLNEKFQSRDGWSVFLVWKYKQRRGEGGCPLDLPLNLPLGTTKRTQQRIIKMVSSGISNITFKNFTKAVLALPVKKLCSCQKLNEDTSISLFLWLILVLNCFTEPSHSPTIYKNLTSTVLHGEYRNVNLQWKVCARLESWHFTELTSFCYCKNLQYADHSFTHH